MTMNQSMGKLISIHAPVKGATRANDNQAFYEQFQSTLP